MTGPTDTQADKDSSRRGTHLPAPIERRVRLSRLFLVWEAVWPAIWPAASFAGLFIALALFGLFARLPLFLHWLLLSGFGAFMVWTLWNGFRGFRWPRREDAFRHLEKSSGLPHTPLSAYEDVPAENTGDTALWAAHRRRITEQLKRLRVGLPSPGLTARDPMALRSIVLLLLAVGIVGTGPGRMNRIAEALLPGTGAVAQVSIEAWITPPSYTGKPPIYLDRKNSETASERAVLKVPAASTLSLRVHGLKNAPVLESSGEKRTKPEALNTVSTGSYSIDTKLTEEMDLALTEGGRMIRAWHFDIEPDVKPTIELTEPLGQSISRSLRFAYKVTDDYGVTKAEARIELDRKNQAEIETGKPAAEPRVTPPQLALPLPKLRPREAEGRTFADLTPHPWAGLPVTITLTASDDAGQEGTAEPIDIVLPAREFTDPLARAIVEQRRRLAFDPRSTGSVARFIDNFTQDGDRYIEDKVVYLSLRAAYWRLTEARRDTDLTGIFDLLWSVALRIEDGDVSLAERDLRDAQKALADALANDAGDEEISRLIAELKEAFKRYMDALMAEQGTDGEMSPMSEFSASDAQTIERGELEAMLNAIGELAESGARDQAKAMLQQMQSILENLQLPGQTAQMNPGEQAMAQAIDKMGEMILMQRELMDRTFKELERLRLGKDDADRTLGLGEEENDEEEADFGLKKHDDDLDLKAMLELGAQQDALRDELNALLGQLQEADADLPGVLKEAEESMGQAIDRLNAGRADRATTSQGQAIDKMRSGAQAMADKLMQGAGKKGRQGRGQAGNDPFGRPMPQSGADFGMDVAVPDKIDMQRAREILEELRKRATELGRPKIELEYLDRLLERF